MTVHPIEAESMRILAGRVDLSRHHPAVRDVVARVVHASADVEFAHTMVATPEAVAAGVGALRSGAVVVTDVEMVRHGLAGWPALCYLPEAQRDAQVEEVGAAPTRSAAGIRLAARRHPRGAVLVVGCAPTALDEVVRLAREEAFSPALVIGLPVGFVGAADAKADLRASGLASITNVGEKGGSAVAAAAFNALARAAQP